MHDFPARRVHTLRLQAPSADLVRRGAILLEDAIHTASLPDGGPGRLLIIRSLRVGKLRGNQSPSSLALHIERELWRLGARAIHAEAPGAAASAAVYFRDPLEACIALARRLVRGERVEDWYWPLAVRAWRPAMARDEALRALLGAALRSAAGAAAGARMLRELREARAVDPLLAALTGSDGRALLRASGFSEISRSSFAAALAGSPLPAPMEAQMVDWLPLLRRWTATWGATDARSLWLAATALLAETPGRYLDPRLSSTAAQLIHLAHTPQAAPAIQADAATDKTHSPFNCDSAPLPAQPATAPDNAATPAASERSAIVSVARAAEAKPARWPDDPQPTKVGGLLFLLPVLARLGVADWLAEHPEWIEAEFAHQLLRRIAQRYAVSDDDPLLALLSSPVLPTRPREFTVPARWREHLTRTPLRLQRSREEKGVRVLTDKTSLLPLALWRGRTPGGVRALIGQNKVRRAPALADADEWELLLRAWLVALRRWCRRYAGLGIGQLVRRPGRVLATRTHLDLFFALDQADVRVRRAGLDLNPGWLPWFGRVVTFHYLPGEQPL